MRLAAICFSSAAEKKPRRSRSSSSGTISSMWYLTVSAMVPKVRRRRRPGWD